MTPGRLSPSETPRSQIDGSDAPRIRLLIASLTVVLAVLVGALLLLPAGERGLALLPLAMAAGVIVRALPSRAASRAVQVALMAIVATALVADGHPALSSVLVLGQLAALLLLADRFTARLLLSRDLERTARLQAQHRADLLDAVQDLPDSDVPAGAVAAVATLRAAGFAAAAVRLLEHGQLVAGHNEGFDAPVDAAGHEQELQALRDDRTVVVGPDPEPAGRRSGGRPLSSSVVVPVPGEAGPVGVVVAAHVQERPVTAHERELVEVLAQYLGTVVATRAALGRQRALLEQGVRLEGMGDGLLAAVSEEIRDPLTVLRLATQLLGHHGPALTDEQHTATLGQLEDASAQLRQVLDSLLDFSRFRAEVTEPELVSGRLGAVLEVAQLDCPATADGEVARSATVVVDPTLAGHGLALVVQAGKPHGGTTVETRPRASTRGHELGLLLTGPGLAAASQVQLELGTRLLAAAGARFEHSPATGSATVWFPTRAGTPDDGREPSAPARAQPITAAADEVSATAGPAAVTVAADLLDDRVARGALLAVVVLAVTDITVGGYLLPRPATVAVLVLAAAVVALTTVRPILPRPLRDVDVELVRASLAGLLGPVLVAAGPLVTEDLDVVQLTPLFMLILLVNGFVAPDRLRVVVLVWASAVWLIVDLLAGSGGAVVFVVHALGVVALVLAIGRSSALLSRRLRRAAAARRQTEQRAELLAALLRTRDVDSDRILAGVADGLRGLGWQNVRVWEVDETAPADVDAPAAGGQRAVRHLRHDGEAIAVVEADPLVGDIDAAEREVVELMLLYGTRALARARRYRSDRAAAAQLQDLDRRISGLLSTVSHELRTPLTVVQGLATTLTARWNALSDASRHELLGRIDANAARLGEMMSRLLESSYLHGGGFELRLVTLPARDLLDDVVGRVEDLLEEHPVTIEADPGLWVRVDPGLLVHVFDNLVVNATVHTPPGSRIWLRAGRAPGGRIEVEVADDGPGIPPHDRELILERFYRGGDDTHRAVTRGLGLGLSIAGDVVEAHGGQLRVGSAAEGGASFTFDVAAG